MSPLWITAAGIVSPLGVGWKAWGEGLEGGADPLRPWTAGEERGAETGRLAARVGAIGNWDRQQALPKMRARRLNDASLFALAAARQALAATSRDSDEVGVVLATETAGNHPVSEFLSALAEGGPASVPPSLFPVCVPSAPATQIAIELGTRAYNATVSAGAAGMGVALDVARQALAGGQALAMLAGVSEELSPFIWNVMARNGEIAPPAAPARPLSLAAAGAVAGEGAYFFLISPEPPAAATGLLARLCALEAVRSGSRSGSEDEAGAGESDAIARAMVAALAAAVWQVSDVDALFVAASGEVAGDAAEARAIVEVFAAPPPLAAVKAASGGGGAGSGAQLAAALWALAAQRLPGSPHSTPPIREDLPLVLGGRPARLERVLVHFHARRGATADAAPTAASWVAALALSGDDQ